MALSSASFSFLFVFIGKRNLLYYVRSNNLSSPYLSDDSCETVRQMTFPLPSPPQTLSNPVGPLSATSLPIPLSRSLNRLSLLSRPS